MSYTETLKITRNILEKVWIPTHILQEPIQWKDEYDHGLRKAILDNYNEIQEAFHKFITTFLDDHTIYHVTDTFHCEYLILRLPEENLSYLLVGPFTSELLTVGKCISLCEEASLKGSHMEYMQQYYTNLPNIADEKFFGSIINTLGEELWGEEASIIWMKQQADFMPDNHYIRGDIDPNNNHIERVNQRYLFEAGMMEYIAQGNWDELEKQLSHKFPAIKDRSSDRIRNRKNFLVILNTLCRKAAERGGVHPVYLDKASQRFAIKIEQAMTISQLAELEHELPRKYCLLVRSHSVRQYSLPVQKAINYISFHLTEDLSLKALSSLVNLNSSYFSALFKKETGYPLTSFVNNARIEHAIYLLNSTHLSIVEIAPMCGISDVNYFSKTFKKLRGFTPSEYRAMIHHPVSKAGKQ